MSCWRKKQGEEASRETKWEGKRREKSSRRKSQRKEERRRAQTRCRQRSGWRRPAWEWKEARGSEEARGKGRGGVAGNSGRALIGCGDGAGGQTQRHWRRDQGREKQSEKEASAERKQSSWDGEEDHEGEGGSSQLTKEGEDEEGRGSR